jgi:UDP:flavonoid glycosyltransferase YjiC (YdhE family)
LSRKTTQNDVDKAGSVVLVIQGTLVNDDLGQLVGPTLTALANEDLTVVASTGGPPVESISAALPPNAKAAAFLPLDRLLPKVSVMAPMAVMAPSITRSVSVRRRCRG